MDDSTERSRRARRIIHVHAAAMRVLVAVIAWLASMIPSAATAPAQPAPLLSIDGPVGPATSAYLLRGLADAAMHRAPLIIVQIDTPGGLDTSMREIVRAILASPVPVIGYVAPSGARAASAGTYILYACHVAAMAPGTNLGAATPIQISTPVLPNGESRKPDAQSPRSPEELKAVNDAVAYIRSLAELRRRNVEWAEKAVREAASLPAEEAVQEHVVDLVADSVPALVRQLNGRSVTLPTGPKVLETTNVVVTPLGPDWRTRVLAVITNPNVATLLLLIGIYGIIFEFYTPGFFGPGVIGAISLLLGLYALHLLPIDYTGLALLLLGIALMVAEVFTPGFGALGLGGLAGFVLGSILLLDQHAPGFTIAWQLVGGVALGMAGLMMAVATMVAQVRRRPAMTGAGEMIGAVGPVVDWHGHSGRVRIRGILWDARANRPLNAGNEVRVTAVNGLTVTVEAASKRS